MCCRQKRLICSKLLHNFTKLFMFFDNKKLPTMNERWRDFQKRNRFIFSMSDTYWFFNNAKASRILHKNVLNVLYFNKSMIDSKWKYSKLNYNWKKIKIKNQTIFVCFRREPCGQTVGWDSGGTGLVSGSAWEHADAQISGGYGFQQGKISNGCCCCCCCLCCNDYCCLFGAVLLFVDLSLF